MHNSSYLYNMIKKDWVGIYSGWDIMDTAVYLRVINGFMPTWVQVSKRVPQDSMPSSALIILFFSKWENDTDGTSGKFVHSNWQNSLDCVPPSIK